MKKSPIFLIILFFLLILVPQVCAQTKTISPEEANVMRTTFVEYSKRYIGKPYIRGATGPDAFDCSGLVFACSREAIGIQLPRQTRAMYSFCTIINDSEREIGDLVFFKTTGDGSVSHVGIYAGNNQFINCASDGPNTGVIISSLKENYWGSHYFQTGRFLPSAKSATTNTASVTTRTPTAPAKEIAQKSTTVQAQKADSEDEPTSGGFLSKLIFDVSGNFDWNFFSAEKWGMHARGASVMLHSMYHGKTVQPGVGAMLRYDVGTESFQLPIVASVTIGEFFRIFFGPVVSLGDPSLPGDAEVAIKHSFFPGIIGVCWQTPSFPIGKIRMSFQQDVHYTVFNDTDDTALSVKNSLAAGLVFSTGVRVTLPLANVL